MTATQKSKPLLTISLLSSNRRDTIRKCLDSLETLRERVSSELVIVDTAQDEDMRALLSEYTDRIIPFTWCNDFSKARNAGLEAAQGEWFLYLDDDEWFLDTKEIEDFFLSGAHKDYTLAYYLQRNFSDYAGTNYNDVRVSRMFRIWNDVKFVSSIHEYPHPLIGKSKLLHSTVEHYGYVYDTEEKKYQHSRRNIPLLLDMIEKERKNPRWWLQLLQEYRTMDRYPEMAKCCADALETFQKTDTKEAAIARGSFYCGILEKHMKFYEYADAERMLEQALSDKHNTQMCRAALYAYGANLSFHKKEYMLCEDYCRKYFAVYKELLGNEEEMYAQGYFFVVEAFNQDNREQMYCLLILCGLKRDDTAALKEDFWKLNWEGKLLFLEDSFAGGIIDAFGRLPYDEEFVKMAAAMMKRSGVDAGVTGCLEKKEHENPEEFERLRKIFLQMTGHQTYILYLRMQELTKAAELEQLLSELSFYEWKVATDYFCSCACAEKAARLKELLQEEAGKYGAQRDYFLLKEAETLLMRCNKENYEELHSCIQNFSQRDMAFYSRFFKESAFDGEMEMLPVQGRIGVKLQAVLEAERAGDVKAVSAALKDCMNVYAVFNDIIRAYTSLFAQREKQRMVAASRKQEQENLILSAQMQQLGLQVKKKIHILLEQNMVAEAKQALEQLKQLLPEDKELGAMEDEIRERLS